MFGPQTGDILKRPKGILIHYGIYLGDGIVYHNSAGQGEHQSSYDEFSQGEKVTYISLPEEKRHEVLSKVQQALWNAKQYDILFNNCEHTVTRIVTGQPYSPQLRTAIGLGALFAFLIGLFAGGKKGA